VAKEEVSVMNVVNISALLAAIQNGKPWLDRFTGKEYDKALDEYRKRFGPLYREAVSSAGEAGTAALAEALLDGLEAGWAKERPWNRSLVRINDRQMIVCYLSPMLLEDPDCAPLAEALRAGWAERRPKEAYQTAPAAKLQKGFRPSIFGIPLPSWGREDED